MQCWGNFHILPLLGNTNTHKPSRTHLRRAGFISPPCHLSSFYCIGTRGAKLLQVQYRWKLWKPLTPPETPRTPNLLSNSHEPLSFIHTPPIYPSICPYPSIGPLRHSPFISHGSLKHPSKSKIFDRLSVCREINSLQPWYDTVLTIVTLHGLSIPL